MVSNFASLNMQWRSSGSCIPAYYNYVTYKYTHKKRFEGCVAIFECKTRTACHRFAYLCVYRVERRFPWERTKIGGLELMLARGCLVQQSQIIARRALQLEFFAHSTINDREIVRNWVKWMPMSSQRTHDYKEEHTDKYVNVVRLCYCIANFRPNWSEVLVSGVAPSLQCYNW